MSLASDIALTGQSAENYAIHTLEFPRDGVSYPCSSGTERTETEYMEGGKFLNKFVTVFLRKVLLTPQHTADLEALTVDDNLKTVDDESVPPRSGMRVRYDRRDYRILRVTDLGSVFQLQLVDPDR
ncbi:MAG: hypothetical protein ACT443_04240 [Gemmatimonadota bacterium]